jgi:hypothetical protein
MDKQNVLRGSELLISPGDCEMATTDDDRRDILRMLATGKITATEAAEMLDATEHLNASESHEPDMLKSEDFADKVESKPRWFHVKVSDMNTGKSTVTVKMPLRIIEYGLALGKHFSPEFSKINTAGLNDLIGSERATLIDVQDEDSSERVEIFID